MAWRPRQGERSLPRVWLLAWPLLAVSPFAAASGCKLGPPSEVYINGALSSQSGPVVNVPVGTTSVQISADVLDDTPGSCTTHSLVDSILSDTTGSAYTFFDGSVYYTSIAYSGFPGPFPNQITINLRTFEPGTVVAEVNCLDCTGVPSRQTYTINIVAAPVANLPPNTEPAQQQVGSAIDEFCPDLPSTSTDPAIIDLRARCLEVIAATRSDPEGVAEALDELFSDVAVVQAEAIQVVAQTQFNNIKARTGDLRSNTGGGAPRPFTFNFALGPLPIGNAFQQIYADEPAAAPETGAAFSRWGFFASGTLGRGKADPGATAGGYDYDSGDLTAGVDYRKTDRLILGAAIGFNRNSNDLALNEGKLDTQGWSVTGYGSYYRDELWYTDFAFSYGRNSFDMLRRVQYSFTLPDDSVTSVDQVARADGDGSTWSATASIGRDFHRNGWGFGPYGRLLYTRTSIDSMTERMIAGAPGAGLGLVLGARDLASLSTVLGGRLTYTHSTSSGVVTPHLDFEWQHEYRTDPTGVTAYFLSDPSQTPFTVTGEALDSEFVRVGLGASFVMTHGRSGFIYYEKLLGRERISQDSLSLGFRIEF